MLPVYLRCKDKTMQTATIPEPDVWRKQLKPEQWEKGKSAWAVAHSWHNAQGLPHEIRSIVGVDAALLRMAPEYAVSLPGFFGPSWCDVFACIEVSERGSRKEYVIVIEAKVEENFGKTIKNWYDDKDSDDSVENKNYRIQKICEKLGIGYDYDKHKNLRYDLFHKTFAALKSAEFWNAEGAIMIVQSFCPKLARFDEFKKFLELFDCRSHMPFGLVRPFYGEPVIEKPVDKATPVTHGELYKVQTPSSIPLFVGWAKCEVPVEQKN